MLEAEQCYENLQLIQSKIAANNCDHISGISFVPDMMYSLIIQSKNE